MRGNKLISEAYDAVIAENKRGRLNGNGNYHTANAEGTVSLDDFYAYSPTHQFIFRPTRELWPKASVNSRISKAASGYLDANRAVEQMTWAPGQPEIIAGKLIGEGGWIERPGSRCYNLYRPPTMELGDANDVGQWLEHLRAIYPDDTNHIVQWLAHRVQTPHEKINHALVLGGAQGIGKDSILEPAKDAVGNWNFVEIAPHQLLGRFNGFVLSVILRISEARDLGDVDRYGFYERLKTLIAAPPDVLRVDEKNRREYTVPNLCGVIITTNHTDGIYLPPDDRRHYVAWSTVVKEDFAEDYFSHYYKWLDTGGRSNVAAYLSQLDLTQFRAKAPPPKTDAWQRIVDSGRAPEEAEIADIIDALGNPDVITAQQLREKAQLMDSDFYNWLCDRRNRRTIPHRMAGVGYVPVRNCDAMDGLWKLFGKRQAVYGLQKLDYSSQVTAIRRLTGVGQCDQ